MTADEWEPFGLTNDERQGYQVLLDGVPSHLRESLVGWVGRQVTEQGDARVAECLGIQRQCRVDLGVRSVEYTPGILVIEALRCMPAEHLLRVADYCLAQHSVYSNRDPAGLAVILREARSKWTVGQRRGKLGLVARVPEGVQDAVEGTIARGGMPGKLLAHAWADVHGLEPDPSNAYARAVRAVEAAAVPVVQPKKADATLGTVLGQMKADADWRLPLREHRDAPGPQLLLVMLRTLWHGHRDRHGGADYRDVTLAEARAAVVLAATLVEWFASGAVERRSAL